jgi:sterol desaturase/sphingolipid hydroxylase (fatty acid hydroxylase superfamily)
LRWNSADRYGGPSSQKSPGCAQSCRLGFECAGGSTGGIPLVQPLARMVEQRKLGLLNRLTLPSPVEIALAVVLMDYTLYIWHRLMHRSGLIWRFHLPHHVDLDLDASTGLRFHFSELILSVPWRAGQILAIGVSPVALSIWQKALMVSILFHHSNVRLPFAFENWLCRIIVTPRMHGIHHSIIRAEEKLNFSSGLTFWDALHGTLKLNVPQEEITIGVPAYLDRREVRLSDVLMMPFRHSGHPGCCLEMVSRHVLLFRSRWASCSPEWSYGSLDLDNYPCTERC